MSTSEMEILTTVIIDCGTYKCRFGLSTDDNPIVVRTIIGHKKSKVSSLSYLKLDDYYVGEEAIEKRAYLDINYPIYKGIFYDWDDMEKIWIYMFKRLNVDPENCRVVITAPIEPISNRKRIADIMFKKLKIRELSINTQIFLISCGADIKNGLVLSSGESFTYMQAIRKEEFLIPERYELSGSDLTNVLDYLLRPKNGKLDVNDLHTLKKQDCFLPENQLDMSSIDMEKYVLSEKCTLRLSENIFNWTEVMFEPAFAGKEFPGIHKALQRYLKSNGHNEKEEMYKNIILAGGNTMFPGFKNTLKKKLRNEYGNEYAIKDSENQENLAWLGGKKLGKLYFIAKKVYDQSSSKALQLLYD